MPLFALGCHRALSASKADNEKVFAYLDDIYVICAPERVLEVHRILRLRCSPTHRSGCTESRRSHSGGCRVPEQGDQTRGNCVERGLNIAEAEQGVKIWSFQSGNQGSCGGF